MINGLPMACSSSCTIFEEFSTALHWLAINKRGCKHVVHILDDFLLITNSYAQAKADLEVFLNLWHQLGFPIAEQKTMLPSQTMVFVGITIDSVLSLISLHVDKIEKCTLLLNQFRHKAKCTLQELQSLIGLLNFACSVIIPGREFLRGIINLTIGVKKPHHHIRITQQARSDIHMWLTFCHTLINYYFILMVNLSLLKRNLYLTTLFVCTLMQLGLWVLQEFTKINGSSVLFNPILQHITYQSS